jgi:hypothetical protein
MLMDLYTEKYGQPRMTMEELKKIRNDKKKSSARRRRQEGSDVHSEDNDDDTEM